MLSKIWGKVKNGFTRYVYALILALVFAVSAVFSLAAADGRPAETIRVCYDTSGRYLYQDANGEFRGFSVEYLYEISKYTDWQYTFVPFNSWADAVQALKDGQIDILPTVLKSPEREKELLFPTQKMGDIYLAVIVPRNSGEHMYGDLSFLKDGLIGVRKNTVDADMFAKWAQDRNIEYHAAVYDDQRDLLAALDAGGIEAAAMSYAGQAKKY